jgi:putative spermidine/putrescine transport system permease protein
MRTAGSGSRLYSWLLLGPGVLIIAVMLVAPLVGVVPFSFGEKAASGFSGGPFTFENYSRIFTDPYLLGIVVRSFAIAAVTTALALLLAMPISYFISRSGPRLKGFLMIMILFPLLAGGVIQSIGWVAILSSSGILSQAGQAAGILDGPLEIMQTPGTLIVIMALIDLPMIVLSIQSSLDAVGDTTERAAHSLGASRMRAFRTVTLPQIMPGVVAGTSLAFVLTVNAYPTPVLIGGSRIHMASPEIYSIVTRDGDWPQGTALALLVVALSLIITGLYSKFMSARFDKWRR